MNVGVSVILGMRHVIVKKNVAIGVLIATWRCLLAMMNTLGDLLVTCRMGTRGHNMEYTTLIVLVFAFGISYWLLTLGA